MNLRRLISREIAHRKTGFFLGALAVAIAVACFAGGMMFLRAHEENAEVLQSAMKAKAEKDLKKLEDQIRRSMKGLGFNIYIYPEGQNLSEVYAQGFASKTMPENFIHKLAESSIVTVNHLLSSLTEKIEWPERQRTVVLVGTGGEVPIAFRDPKKPLIEPVAKGTLVLGYELHHGLDLEEGDNIEFRGKTYRIAKTYSQRGSADDITMWMNLEEAQEILEKPGLINAILALECNCESVDRLGEIRKEISAILPDTTIIEKESTALARAEARIHAKKLSEKRLAALEADHEEMREDREATLAWLIPLVAVTCLVWIGILALINVRHRINEIGALRALGLRSSGLMFLLLGRALILGLAGVLIGLVLVFILGSFAPFSHLKLVEIFWIALLAPLMAAAATWLPALNAARSEPSAILNHD